MTRPILYSFRRCPYAMRARLAVASAGIEMELREVLLRDKAPAFLAASPSATVPCMDNGGAILDESRDIMIWALMQNDPEGWLDMPDEGHAIIDTIEGPFKTALDRYKYSTRYADTDKRGERAKASAHLWVLNDRLADRPYLFGDKPTLADMATLPFVRQFANTDKAWFDTQDWPHLARWVNDFIDSERFKAIMTKYPVWKAGDDVTLFPS